MFKKALRNESFAEQLYAKTFWYAATASLLAFAMLFFQPGFLAHFAAAGVTAVAFYFISAHMRHLSGVLCMLGIALLLLPLLAIWLFHPSRRILSVCYGLVGAGSGMLTAYFVLLSKMLADLRRIFRNLHRSLWKFSLYLIPSLATAAFYILAQSRQRSGALSLLIACLFVYCCLTAFYLAVLQPLTPFTHKKLLALEDTENEMLRAALKARLIDPHTERVSARVLAFLIRPFYPRRVRGKKNIQNEFSNVFVSNHCEVFGPVAMTLWFPLAWRSWSQHKMLDPTLCAEHMYNGTFKNLKWLPRFLRRPLANFFAPMVSAVLLSLNPIPVYEQSKKSVIETLMRSTQALAEMDNLLIFPENPAKDEGKYAGEGVGTFFSGFAHIGKSYYKACGKALSFYPVYCDRKTRTITIGEQILFDPERPLADEKLRITQTLHDTINRMADALKNKGEHL